MSLQDALKNRQKLLGDGLELIRYSKVLFDTYGKDLLTGPRDRFAALEKSLTSQEVHMSEN